MKDHLERETSGVKRAEKLKILVPMALKLVENWLFGDLGYERLMNFL